jgi:hypothetical protein
MHVIFSVLDIGIGIIMTNYFIKDENKRKFIKVIYAINPIQVNIYK